MVEGRYRNGNIFVDWEGLSESGRWIGGGNMFIEWEGMSESGR